MSDLSTVPILQIFRHGSATGYVLTVPSNSDRFPHYAAGYVLTVPSNSDRFLRHYAAGYVLTVP